MAVKSISQFSLTTQVIEDDLILLQRGNDFRSVESKNLPGKLIEAQLALSSADILALRSTPIQIIAAQGANTYIVPLSISAKNFFNTTAYTSGNSLRVKYTGSAEGDFLLGTDTGFVSASSTQVQLLTATGSTKKTLNENTALEVFINTADPTLGDGTFIVVGLFRVVTF